MQVLIIEDDPASLELLQERLAAMDYLTLATHTVDDAMRIAVSYHPTVVFADLKLDGNVQTGISLIRLIKENPLTANIPVIVHSVYDRLAADVVESGLATASLPKPFSMQELTELLGRIPPAAG